METEEAALGAADHHLDLSPAPSQLAVNFTQIPSEFESNHKTQNTIKTLHLR